MIPLALLDEGRLPIDQHRVTDVVVVGGGTAGMIAATAAARAGASVVLCEYLPFLGGTHGGGGMVMGTIGFRVIGAKDTGIRSDTELVVRGIPLDYYNRMLAFRATNGQHDEPPNGWPKDLELSKVVAEAMVLDAGADIWFMTQFVDVVVDGGRPVGVLVTRGGGLTLVRCDSIVDATGDAIVARRAGCTSEMGRPSDGKTEAATLYFEMGGVDLDRLLSHLEDHPEDISPHHLERGISAATLRRDLERGDTFVVRIGVGYAKGRDAETLPVPVGASHREPSFGTFWMHWRDGRWVASSFSINIDTTYGVDPTVPDELDDALVASRRFALDMVRHYQRFAPGFEDAYLLRFATTLGVREGPRVIGDYMLTAADVFAATDFPDAVGRSGVRVDIHPEDEGGREFLLRSVGGTRGWYQIPYRSLLPAKVDSVLVAGRCISADHIAHGSIRHQVTCMVTGQAAGVGAALAARTHRRPREIDIALLQTTLREQEVLI